MPLDDIWWDPSGPFGDNAEGRITASVMRDFAKAVAQYGATGSWFNIMFDTTAITPTEWTTVDVTKVLWLKKTAPFAHSADWEYAVDAGARDTYTFLAPDNLTVQVTYSPSIVTVSDATAGTTVTPVVAMTQDHLIEPADNNTHAVGPTVPITSDFQTVDLGGWATVVMADTERCMRFGLRFDPPPGDKIDDGALTFNVDPTGLGSSAVARPLAPSV